MDDNGLHRPKNNKEEICWQQMLRYATGRINDEDSEIHTFPYIWHFL